ncbi:hypothetical protein C8Q74DRAFT_1449429 [Fomes fomentarius]|nr:hypothetical protein C8Q74DRAFT_1449429 [Fomes fomentarius]
MENEDYDITVHHFRPEASYLEDIDASKLLEEVARLVLSTTHETTWHDPPTFDSSRYVIGAHCFEVSTDAPRCIDPGVRRSGASAQSLPEWQDNVVVEEEEEWALGDLEEFDHSHLHRLLDSRPALTNDHPKPDNPTVDQPPPTMGKSVKRDAENSVASQSVKRPKLEEASLHTILTLPHFYSSRPTQDDPDFQRGSLSKLKPSPIPPHTLESAQAYIDDPFARLGWVIPIRGRLQFNGATSASMSACGSGDQSSTEQCLPVAPKPPGDTDPVSELIWTPDALVAFWEFLKGLREAGRIGPLSLSFHAVHSLTTPSMVPYSYVGSHKQTTGPSGISSSMSTIIQPSASTGPAALPLQLVDHVKVYHDARYTQSVRAILRAWSYQMDGQKIRLLKDARLVLVDERSRGLLIC